MSILQLLIPEIFLCIAGAVLVLLGTLDRTWARRAAGPLALLATAFVFGMLLTGQRLEAGTLADEYGALRIYQFAWYIKLLAAGVGILLVLLAWPSDELAMSNPSAWYGKDTPEFFALILFSLAGLQLVAGANDMVVLFLGIELASIPTYILVSISRPVSAAQEAGVKYFFLGAMSAALMLLGFSYIYGASGTTDLAKLGSDLALPLVNALPDATVRLSPFMVFGVVLLILGFAFKLAAFPLHFYAGDVYQGAATPVTALLSFVPKATGLVALIKVLWASGGNGWAVDANVSGLLALLAIITMTVGNVLGLMQYNVKRVLAYGSVAHSGYMLVGVAVLASVPGATSVQTDALRGVLFYLAAYGIMNVGAFGVLMLLPARPPRFLPNEPLPPATTAETFEDLAGAGRRHPLLGLAMAVCCLSLIGLPLTVGFFGKIYLIRPALDAMNHSPASGMMLALVIFTVANAAISAAYYLKIVGAMFIRPEPTVGEGDGPPPRPAYHSGPVALAIALSVAGTLLFGTILPATEVLNVRAATATQIESSSLRPQLTLVP